MVWVARGRLEHHFNLHGTDGKAEAFTGCRELVHLQLHLLLSVGTVILEEKVSNGIVSQLRDGLQAPLVEQCPIEPLPDLNVCIAVSECMVLLGRKHRAEQCLSKHVAMFDIVGYWE